MSKSFVVVVVVVVVAALGFARVVFVYILGGDRIFGFAFEIRSCL